MKNKKENLVIYDNINNDFIDVESLDDALSYTKELYIEDGDIHPDIEDVVVYQKVGQIGVEDLKDGTCKVYMIELSDKHWLEGIKHTVSSDDDGLSPDYLKSLGWITEFDDVLKKTFYIEPNIKKRDKISVEFEQEYYRVYHGKERTFIALETSLKWFQLHYMLQTYRD